MNSIVYALYCPKSNKPRYVGKGKTIDRPFKHIKEKSHSEQINAWVNRLRSEGKEPVVVLLEHAVPPGKIDSREAHWIRVYKKAGHKLFNSNLAKLAASEPPKLTFIATSRRIFGHALREARITRRLTQEDLSELTGIAQTRISLIELGKQAATFDTLLRITATLGLEIVVQPKPKIPEKKTLSNW